MVGKAGKSGRPPTKRAGLYEGESVRVESWPWVHDEIPWTHKEIFDHVSHDFEALGITRSQGDVDFVLQLVDNYFAKQSLSRVIEKAAEVRDTKSLGDAYRILKQCNEKISAARTQLGVGKNGKREPRKTSDGSNVVDFSLADYE